MLTSVTPQLLGSLHCNRDSPKSLFFRYQCVISSMYFAVTFLASAGAEKMMSFTQLDSDALPNLHDTRKNGKRKHTWIGAFLLQLDFCQTDMYRKHDIQEPQIDCSLLIHFSSVIFTLYFKYIKK